MITEMGIKRQEKSLSPDVSVYKYRCYIAEMGQIFALFLWHNQWLKQSRQSGQFSNRFGNEPCYR
jgi:hypothetical protein